MSLPVDAIRAVDKKALEFELPPAHVLAVTEVESAGKVYAVVNGQNMPMILFEPHILYRRTSGAARDELVSAGLASPRWNKKLYGKTQAQRWAQIFAAADILVAHGLPKDAAYESASYGVGQVMGYHWKALGFEDMGHFLDVMKFGVDGQVDIMLRYIVVNGLDDELRAGQWKAFARGYNGAGYAKNRYDTRLAAAAARQGAAIASPDGMLRMGSKGGRVRELQALLLRAGYQVKVDGDYGTATKDAVRAFQRQAGLSVDGVYGPETETALGSFRQSAEERPGAQAATEIDEVKQGAGGAAIGIGIEVAQQKIDDATVALQQLDGVSQWVSWGLTAMSVVAAGLAVAGVVWAIKGWLDSKKTVEA